MAANKRYHGVEYGSSESLPDGVGIYLTTDGCGNRREELSFSSGILRKNFGELAARAARLHRHMTGEDISISEAERHILEKLARACRYRAKLMYDRINDRLNQRERDYNECLRRAAIRERQAVTNESLAG